MTFFAYSPEKQNAKHPVDHYMIPALSALIHLVYQPPKVSGLSDCTVTYLGGLKETELCHEMEIGLCVQTQNGLCCENQTASSDKKKTDFCGIMEIQTDKETEVCHETKTVTCDVTKNGLCDKMEIDLYDEMEKDHWFVVKNGIYGEMWNEVYDKKEIYVLTAVNFACD